MNHFSRLNHLNHLESVRTVTNRHESLYITSKIKTTTLKTGSPESTVGLGRHPKGFLRSDEELYLTKEQLDSPANRLAAIQTTPSLAALVKSISELCPSGN